MHSPNNLIDRGLNGGAWLIDRAAPTGLRPLIRHSLQSLNYWTSFANGSHLVLLKCNCEQGLGSGRACNVLFLQDYLHILNQQHHTQAVQANLRWPLRQRSFVPGPYSSRRCNLLHQNHRLGDMQSMHKLPQAHSGEQHSTLLQLADSQCRPAAHLHEERAALLLRPVAPKEERDGYCRPAPRLKQRQPYFSCRVQNLSRQKNVDQRTVGQI